MKSLEELNRIRAEAQEMIRLRKSLPAIRIIIGAGTPGIAAGAREVTATTLDEIRNLNLVDQVLVMQSGEVNQEGMEPVVVVEKPNEPQVVYGRVNAARMKEIIRRHILMGQIIKEWVVA